MDSASEKTMVQPDQFCRHCNKKLPPPCPKCGGFKVTCNGKDKDSGRQKHRCEECPHQFVSDPSRPRITDKDWRTVDLLLGGAVDVKLIHLVTGISKRHIYNRKNSMES